MSTTSPHDEVIAQGEELEPLGDIRVLLDELREAGLYARRSTFVAYFLRFSRRDAAESAQGQALADGWSTATYHDDGGLVVRLSRQGAVTGRRLQRDREFVRGVAHTYDARWDALAIEDLEPDEYWHEVAERHYLRRTEPSPVVPEQRTAEPADRRYKDDRETA